MQELFKKMLVAMGEDPNREGLRAIGPVIETMAEAEALGAHKNAVTIRLASL